MKTDYEETDEFKTLFGDDERWATMPLIAKRRELVRLAERRVRSKLGLTASADIHKHMNVKNRTNDEIKEYEMYQYRLAMVRLKI